MDIYQRFDINKCNKNSSRGCVLEVDLEYSKELRKLHNDYPLAPKKIDVKKEMLSKYQLLMLIFVIFLLVIMKNWCVTFLIKKTICLITKTCNFI